MKARTATLMLVATAVPLLLTSSLLLVLFSYTFSSAGGGGLVCAGGDGAQEPRVEELRLLQGDPWRSRSGCARPRSERGGDHGDAGDDDGGSSRVWGFLHGRRRRRRRKQQQESAATYSDVRYNQVRNMAVTEQDLRELQQASGGRFNLTDPRTLTVLRLVKWHFRAWEPVPVPVPAAAVDGDGDDTFSSSDDTSSNNNNSSTTTTTTTSYRSAWPARAVREAVLNYTGLMACCLHVRVADGTVYFRYGTQAMTTQYRLDRGNDFVAFAQAAVDAYNLTTLRADLLLNTCDHALSRSSAADGARSNHLVWSPHTTGPAATDADVAVPDLLDLRPAYLRMSAAELALARARAPPWPARRAAAVFRGATTNFWMRLGNWVSSPRVRLARLSQAHPGLLDAGITRWSHVEKQTQREVRDAGGVGLVPGLDEDAKARFRYEVVVDGGMGGGRLCGVLLTERALVMQESPFLQFFYPLMKRGRHFFETDHSFRNLPAVLRYMQAHDAEVRRVVDAARRDLAWTCSIHGRTLAFALLLVKYHALQDPGFYRGQPDPEHLRLVQPPASEVMCPWGPATRNTAYAFLKLPRDFSVGCPTRAEPRVLDMPGCPCDCNRSPVEADWRWLSSLDLQRMEGVDWWKTYIPET